MEHGEIKNYLNISVIFFMLPIQVITANSQISLDFVIQIPAILFGIMNVTEKCTSMQLPK